jgi:hypothetical protein
MQRSGAPDVRIKYFDVPPLEGGADLRRAEPMWAMLDPPPSANWVDLFHELIDEADHFSEQLTRGSIKGAWCLRQMPRERPGPASS